MTDKGDRDHIPEFNTLEDIADTHSHLGMLTRHSSLVTFHHHA
jgi:hypothetical protein